MKVLCKIGIHSWENTIVCDGYVSLYCKVCRRCERAFDLETGEELTLVKKTPEHERLSMETWLADVDTKFVYEVFD